LRIYLCVNLKLFSTNYQKARMIAVTYHNIYQHPLPNGHRFPMLKYELIPQQLLLEGIIQQNQFITPLTCELPILELTHTRAYIHELKMGTLTASHIRKIGFPWSEQLYHREITLCQGTIDCAIYALSNGAALNIAGGTHHAFADRGEGFCLFNDIAVAANYLLYKKLANNILIIDLDVHQGNGTASLFNKNPAVFTLSMHGKNNYPFHKETSDLDIELLDATDDETYLTELKCGLIEVQNRFTPDFVFYNAGVDILHTDKFGRLQVTQNGCAERDKLVFNFCKSLDIPIAVAMGGGYSPNIQDIVNAHVNTFRIAASIFD
jgi:acetoin utilization deacetylase AcuC-like enzyme